MMDKDVSLVDSMGSDLSVVNAARVSFGKISTEITVGDKKLIAYLAKNNHWTPFGHTSISFHITAPIFVARQLAKHQVGLVWNEISRRYVSEKPDAWFSNMWREQSEDKKQGSETFGVISQGIVEDIYASSVAHSIDAYTRLLKLRVCEEQARAVLPQSTYTEWYWTGSVAAFARVCKLRTEETAQEETREVALAISDHCAKLFPVSWKELNC
jgi:thymidylate synthase (FAD)